jgi:hypothetical protein
MSHLARMVGFAIAVAAATGLFGWWTVPLLAVLVTVGSSRVGMGPLPCSLGAALGWTLLLGWDALHGSIGVAARRTGGALGVGTWGFTLATLLFPALLAGLAARVVRRARTR